MGKQARHGEILHILQAEHRIEGAELAERLNVSEITVRRDLHELEAVGSLRRVHGGAIHTVGRALERPFEVRSQAERASKSAIAAAAALMVENGDAIALDVGSTVARMVDHLTGVANLTIVTASLRTAWEVANSKNLLRPLRLIVAGGVVTDDEMSMVGQSAIEHFRKLRVDTAFLGVGGVNAAAGLTDFNLEDAELKRVIVGSARQVVVLADSSKLETEQFVQVAELASIDVVITDTGASAEALAELREAGVAVTVVQPMAD